MTRARAMRLLDCPAPDMARRRDSGALLEGLGRERGKPSSARALSVAAENSRTILEFYDRSGQIRESLVRRASSRFSRAILEMAAFFIHRRSVRVELQPLLVDHALPERDLGVDERLEVGGRADGQAMSGSGPGRTGPAGPKVTPAGGGGTDVGSSYLPFIQFIAGRARATPPHWQIRHISRIYCAARMFRSPRQFGPAPRRIM